MYLPASLAADTIESLYAEQGPEQPRIYQALLIGLAVAIGSLPFIQLDVAVRAPGIVRPALERTELRPASGGFVTQVLVRDNESVQAGQPLLVLSSAEVDERLAHNRVRQEKLADRVADLEQATSASEDRPPAAWKTPAIHQEWNSYLAHLESGRLAEAKANSDYTRHQRLAEKGIATRQELENARFETERLRAELRLLRAQTLARWEARLLEEKAALQELVSEQQLLEQEQENRIVRAPARGVVMGFSGWSPGGFVAAGQTLGAVSPEEALQIETHVTSRDAGLIRIGQRVRLQIDAYNHTWWGTLEGEVASIGADVFATEGAAPVYKVVVHPLATSLVRRDGTMAGLRKGQTVSARFLVARRSAWELLYDEAGAWLNPQDRHSV